MMQENTSAQIVDEPIFKIRRVEKSFEELGPKQSSKYIKEATNAMKKVMVKIENELADKGMEDRDIGILLTNATESLLKVLENSQGLFII